MRLCKTHSATLWAKFMVGLWLATGIGAVASGSTISGHLEDGLRHLPVPPAEAVLHFTVIRGDAITFDLSSSDAPMMLKVPDLGIAERLTAGPASAPIFKMTSSGQFPLTLDGREGLLEVVDYQPANYREMTAAEAAAFATREDPLVLDVRTPAEFQRGHLPNAVLIPVQVLQRRIDELSAYRQRDILVYCATGNRSTVASKILIDQGFTRIVNLRYGIVDWQQRKYPITR